MHLKNVNYLQVVLRLGLLVIVVLNLTVVMPIATIIAVTPEEFCNVQNGAQKRDPVQQMSLLRQNLLHHFSVEVFVILHPVSAQLNVRRVFLMAVEVPPVKLLQPQPQLIRQVPQHLLLQLLFLLAT
jgi:hypothetical protein